MRHVKTALHYASEEGGTHTCNTTRSSDSFCALAPARVQQASTAVSVQERRGILCLVTYQCVVFFFLILLSGHTPTSCTRTL